MDTLFNLVCIHTKDPEITRVLLCVCKWEEDIWVDKHAFNEYPLLPFWSPLQSYCYGLGHPWCIVIYHMSSYRSTYVKMGDKIIPYDEKAKGLEGCFKLNNYDCEDVFVIDISTLKRYLVLIVGENVPDYNYFDTREEVDKLKVELKDYDSLKAIIDLSTMKLGSVDTLKRIDVENETYY